MRSSTISAVESFRREFPGLFGEPASDAEIAAVEREMGLLLDADFRQFLQLFGSGVVGPYRILGTKAGKRRRPEEQIPGETMRAWKDGWPPRGWCVISFDLLGNPIAIGPDSAVWKRDHNLGELGLLARSFDDFLVRTMNEDLEPLEIIEEV